MLEKSCCADSTQVYDHTGCAIGNLGFSGCTKVYEYQVDGVTKRQFSVAHVVRPRTKSSNACLCFTLLSKVPDHKPWKRAIGEHDPSRGIILDLQEKCDWEMPSTVLLPSSQVAVSLEDDRQLQCLPVFGSDRPKWMYRKLPKVTKIRHFGSIPPWGRRPQKMTYHLCAEDITKNAIVHSLPEDERADLLQRGILPTESSAKDRFCVMCPVKRGSPRLLPCSLCNNWCHIGCRYWKGLSLSCADLRSQEEDHGTKASIS